MNKKLLETIRCEDGRAVHLDYHQQRVDASLRALGCSASLGLAAIIDVPDDALYRCRIVYDGTSYQVEYIPYRKRTVRTLQPIVADKLDYALKYADREALDQLFAQKGDADDILIIKEGCVTDTSIANIAFYDGRLWRTPKHPLLKGTTRTRLLDEGKIVEEEIHLSDLPKFTRFALLNAMIGFDEIKDGIIAPLKGGK